MAFERGVMVMHRYQNVDEDYVGFGVVFSDKVDVIDGIESQRVWMTRVEKDGAEVRTPMRFQRWAVPNMVQVPSPNNGQIDTWLEMADKVVDDTSKR